MEEKLILIFCLICSLIGLSLIYFSAKNVEIVEVKLFEVTPEIVGRVVSTKGKIVYKRLHPSGHLFLTLEEGGTKIQIPIFSSLMSKLEENGISEENFSIGKILEIKGLVDEYQGKLQIIPRKVDDLRLE